MSEVKMQNPYETLGEKWATNVLGGNRGKIGGDNYGLSERLKEYAFYVQENAKTTGNALLVSDLLDASRRLSREG